MTGWSSSRSNECDGYVADADMRSWLKKYSVRRRYLVAAILLHYICGPFPCHPVGTRQTPRVAHRPHIHHTTMITLSTSSLDTLMLLCESAVVPVVRQVTDEVLDKLN